MDSGRLPMGQGSLSLPNEIWTMILERVERTNDLLACRLVNQLWRSRVTLVCRRRFLRLNVSRILGTSRIPSDFDSFCSTFENCDEDDLPWSACQLDLHRYRYYDQTGRHSHSSRVREFIRLFGGHIHELIISGKNNRGLMSIMNGVPNITRLDISAIGIDSPIRESLNVHLGKLKGLNVSISNVHTFHFFELILNRPEVKLRTLQLKIKPNAWLVENCDVLSTLITGIPVVHLELNRFLPELFIQLTRKRVQVHQLVVQLDAPLRFAIPYSYTTLEVFLQNTADSLKNLTLIDNQRKRQRENSTLTIPTLPQLTYLGVKVGKRSGRRLLSNVTPFTPDQFPRLAKVKAHDNSRFGRVTLFDLGPFHTVSALELEDYYGWRWSPLQTDWDQIFPNLKELDAGTTGSGLQLILTKFQRLERLFVSLTWSKGELLGEILSGGKGAERRSGTRSLLSFTRLKEFSLKLSSQHTLSDAFVDSCLLRIQPLDNLYLENVIISEEYKDKLEGYHTKAEIHIRPSIIFG